jgi:hypothetical protein
MRGFSDELIAAYVDGELAQAECAPLEQALATDTALAARVAAQRALRRRLGEAYEGVLHEPAPQRLLQILESGVVREPDIEVRAAVIELDRERALRQARQRARAISSRWLAIAAAVVVGVAVGVLWQYLPAGALTETRNGALLARGALARALNEQLASAPSGPVRVGLSFHARDGGYCRTFVLNDAPARAGLACHRQDDWLVQTLVNIDAGDAQRYRMASSNLPPALLQAVSERIVGDSLDADGERAARARGWR